MSGSDVNESTAPTDGRPRRLVYDPKLWGGRDQGDNTQFYKTAVVLNEYVDSEGRLLADVRFDHDGRTSKGHFVDAMRDVIQGPPGRGPS